jgi:hypothetical protein
LQNGGLFYCPVEIVFTSYSAGRLVTMTQNSNAYHKRTNMVHNSKQSDSWCHTAALQAL